MCKCVKVKEGKNWKRVYISILWDVEYIDIKKYDFSLEMNIVILVVGLLVINWFIEVVECYLFFLWLIE